VDQKLKLKTRERRSGRKKHVKSEYAIHVFTHIDYLPYTSNALWSTTRD